MILPDINLLLYAYDAESPHHAKAAGWLEGCFGGEETVGLLPVVLFGFVRLATSPRVYHRPMTPALAAGCVRMWLTQPNARLLEPGPGHPERVFGILEKLGTGGNLLTDAQLAAAALENNAVVHSADTDFLRFEGIRWFNPLTGAGTPAVRRTRKP